MLLVQTEDGFAFVDAYRPAAPPVPASHAYIKRNILYGLCFATGNVPMIGLMRTLTDSHLDTVADSGLMDLLT